MADDAAVMEETKEEPTETPPESPKEEVKEEAKEAPKEEPPAEPKSEVPEKYELTLTKGSMLDDKSVDRIAAIAREQGLSNDQAQTLLQSVESETLGDRNRRVADWEGEVKSDKELGGENFANTQLLARKGLDWLVPADQDGGFRQLLDASGYGSHPAVVSAMVRLGKALQEDKPLSGGTEPGDKSPEAILKKLYDHPTSKEE